MHGLEELIAGRVAPGVYRWPIEADELFRTAKKAPSAKLTRTPEGRLALPMAMGGGHADVEMPPWLRDAEEAGWEVFGLGPATSKSRRGSTGGRSRRIPEWFGGNWDAFYDSLTDLEWLPAQKGYLVVFAGWSELAAGDPSAFETTMEVFRDATDAWAESETPMMVVLPGSGPAIEALPVLS
jgi:hypothetical protein